ncbi:MAG: hypothetical protein H0T05_03055 [Acidobacteria bacterium]|nr:hypothetical protein [Acidobacteriota bacterium]
MSVSDAARREDQKRTLITMFRTVGDHRAWQVYFHAGEPEIAETLQTTWRELIDQGLVTDKQSVMGRARYSLTYAGWLRAFIISGDIDTPEVRDRCSRLAKALKSVVKGRQSHYDEFATASGIAADADLPEGWVVNAIHSKLLGVVFPDDKWDAHMEDGRTIRVSPTFGLNHLFDEE